MKRGNKFFLYILGITFSFLFMFLFAHNPTLAAVSDDGIFSFECFSAEDDFGEEAICGGENTTISEYKLIEVNITDPNISELTIPSTFEGKPVAAIKSEVINSPQVLNLQTIILPEQLKVIEDRAFNNVATLSELVIPRSIEEIGHEVFYVSGDENIASVTNVYLNTFTLSGLRNLTIYEDSFPSKNVARVISTSISTHESLVTKLGDEDEDSDDDIGNYVTVVTYHYYSNIDKQVKLESLQYYVNGFGNQIYDSANDINKVYLMDQVPSGFGFDCWEVIVSDSVKTIVSGSKVEWDSSTTEYVVVPRFKLNEATFDQLIVVSTDKDGNPVNQIRYDSSENLLKLTLDVNNNGQALLHELFGQGGFQYSLVWMHGNETIKTEEGLTEATISEHLVNRVSHSGDYSVKVNYSYTYEYACGETTCTKIYVGSNDISTINIQITPAPLYIKVLDINKVYGEQWDVNNEIQYTSIGLLGDDAIVSVEKSLDTHATYNKVGTYVNVVRVRISAIKNSNTTVNSNYNVIYSYGDYIIAPRVVEVNYNADEDGEIEYLEFTYGQPISITKVFNITDIYGGSENIIVTFIKAIGMDVGEYTLERIEFDNNNYRLSFDKNKEKAKVKIIPKAVNVCLESNDFETNVNNCVSSDESFTREYRTVYNGNSKIISAYYNDINGKKIYIDTNVIKGGTNYENIVNAGTYHFLSESLGDSNYSFASDADKDLSAIVEKADPTITAADTQNFTYTGQRIYPKVSINNQEQSPTFECRFIGLSDPNYCIDVRENYTVTVKYAASENYIAKTKTILVNIREYKVNLNPKKFTFYYGETLDVSEELIINGEKVIAVYSTNAGQNPDIGVYNITGVTISNPDNPNFRHKNYIGSIIPEDAYGTIEIVPRPIELVYFGYSDLVYTGLEIKVGAYAIDILTGKVLENLDVKVFCDEKIIKDAKTYHLRAKYDDEKYVSTNSNLLVLDVAKAKYDLSNIQFKDKKFALDFNEHSIFIEGTLPEGVEVAYTIDGVEGNSTSSAFKHVVTASFIIDAQNYMPVDDMSAILHIDMTWVFVTIAFGMFIICAAVIFFIQHAKYRRTHPKKIKLKIQNIIGGDLAAIRSASNLHEAMGGITRTVDVKQIKKVVGAESIDESIELALEDEDDIIESTSRLKSFIDRIYAADSELKYYYSEVKNELLSYEGITHSVDRKYEVFHNGAKQIAKLSICNRILRLYVNLDPEVYDKEQYNHRNMSKFECHARTPLRINVDSEESLRHAKIFIRILRKKENLKAVTSFAKIDYEKFYTLKENIFPKIFKKMTIPKQFRKKKKK